MNRMLMAGALALLVSTGCSRDGERIAGAEDGPTRILLTDAPFPYDTVERVDVYIVRVDVATSADTTAAQDWQPVSAPHRRFNLLDLQSGVTTLLGSSAVHFAGIAMVRVVINTDSSRVVYVGGGDGVVQWGTAGELTIHAAVEQPLVNWASATGDVVLDFDVGRSFTYIQNDYGPIAKGFVFIPWVRAVNAQAAATIHGTVRSAIGPADELEPVPNATVEAYRTFGDEGPSYVVATARTGPDGTYTLRYLNAGDYVLVAAAPGFYGLAAQSQVTTLLMGDDRVVNLTVPAGDSTGGGGAFLLASGPSEIALGDTAWYSAVVFNGTDSLTNSTITWSVLDASVATLTTSMGPSAGLVGEALGSTWLVVTSGTLADSVAVSVVTSTDTTGGGGDGGPVASVTVSPPTATVSVGDSLGFYATLKDSTGATISGHTVAWSVSDSSVVQVFGVFGQSLILKALKAGTATVTASSEGQAGSATVTVN